MARFGRCTDKCGSHTLDLFAFDCGECDAGYANAHCDNDADPNKYKTIYGKSNRHSNAHKYKDANSHADADTYSHSNTDKNTNADNNSYCERYLQLDTGSRCQFE